MQRINGFSGPDTSSGTPDGDADSSSGTPDGPAPRERQQDPAAQARSIVLRQLTNAPKSRRQLAAKLAERDIPPEVAEAVLDRFEEVRLVDDAEFAQMWVQSRSQTRSLARGALKRELADKGITGDIAEDALDQVSDQDEEAAARALVHRRLQASADLTDRAVRDKQTRRLVAMLARKGYPPSMAYRVVNEVIANALGQALDDHASDFFDAAADDD